MLTEYDASFATKEYLLQNGYTIITWNPPGSQGTFTIPNPGKDPTYKGQTGSESPDLIAFKGDEMVLIEVKDSINKCYDDIEKIRNLLANKPRKQLLFDICNYQMNALGIKFDAYKCKLITGIAIPFHSDYVDIEKNYTDVRLYLVTINNKNWDNKVINSKKDINGLFSVSVKGNK